MTGVAAIAGGTGLWLVVDRVRSSRFRTAVDRGAAFAPNVFLAVEPAGDVVIWLTRSEMGQGVETALPMIVAEELDADWSRVRVERAVLDQRFDYGSMMTAASSSVTSMWTELRRAGAAARHMLLRAAADAWSVPLDELMTEQSTVTHVHTSRRIGYGELADAAAHQWPPLRPRLKNPREFRLIGRAMPRRDADAKISGAAVFGLDVRLPGMLYAAIARNPTFGGRPIAIDDSSARLRAGVVDVVAVPTGIAVVGVHSHAALRGRDELRLEWPPPADAVSSAALSSALRAALTAENAKVARDDRGAADALRDQPAITAVYEVPYLAHAPLEPMNCVANVTAERCEIWAPTQTPDDALATAARITTLPPDRIVVHTTYLGGGFGRRTATDFVAEAVDLSLRIGKPVQVLWSREDDMRNGLYRPAVAQRLDASVDDAGRPSAWRHRVASVHSVAPVDIDGLALMGATDLPYSVGAMRVEWLGVQAPLPTTIWRSVGHSFTAFAIESFVDELAHSLGRDPLAYRLSLLPAASRLRRCIQEVADLSGWSQHGDPDRHVGVAAAECFGSYIALVAEVASIDGSLRVAKMWCAVDCGVVINSDTAAAQVEGGILFGLTAALHGQITIANGAVVEGNFDSYPLLRIDETPQIELRFLASADEPGGLGELGVPVGAPAVANALFAATGRRARRLPLALNG